MLLNVLLVGILCALGWEFRQMHLHARTKRTEILAQAIRAMPVNRPAPLVKVPPLDAAAYQELVAKNLFSADRNPSPIPDPPPPPAPPPPVPEFPVARGVMLWPGVPPTIVLADKGKQDQKGYHPGDKFRDWTIVSVDNKMLVLEWNGQKFEKRLDELMDRTPIQMAEAPPQVSATAVTAAVGTRQNLAKGASEGPGQDMGGGYRGCVANDKTPAGTVVDGLKKTVSETPFGTVCRWEPAQ